MKVYYLLLITLIYGGSIHAGGDSLLLAELICDAETELVEARHQFLHRAATLQGAWAAFEQSCDRPDADPLVCLQRERTLTRQWMNLQQEEQLRLLQIRYRKGVELIKLLYEKILALDHHFSSMNTYQNILLMANPNNYPDFRQIKSVLEERLRKRNALSLPGILQSNSYLSATFSLITSLLGDGETSEKQQNLEAISCILDFTVRMRADLGVIQHETEYLKISNQQLKEACERLFADYVQVIGYLVPLDRCRTNDDWENLYMQLDQQIEDMQAEMQQAAPVGLPTGGWNRQVVNLEFATQRVAEFIGKYNDFINLGTQYYQKFDNIVTNYENEEQCAGELPYQFGELRSDIAGTIDKFHNTYRLPEIQGSRMKDLLYGMPE